MATKKTVKKTAAKAPAAKKAPIKDVPTPKAKKVAAKKAPAKKVVVKRAPAAPRSKGKVKLVLETGGKEYLMQTDDIQKSLAGLGLDKLNFSTKTIIRASTKDHNVEKVLNVHAARKMFRHPLTLEIFARNLGRALAL